MRPSPVQRRARGGPVVHPTAARKHLDRFMVRARGAGVRASGVVLHGIPHEEIVRVRRVGQESGGMIGHARDGGPP